MVAQREAQGYVEEPWRIAAHKLARAGDRVWVLRQGKGPKAIFGAGHRKEQLLVACAHRGGRRSCHAGRSRLSGARIYSSAGNLHDRWVPRGRGETQPRDSRSKRATWEPRRAAKARGGLLVAAMTARRKAAGAFPDRTHSETAP